MKSRYDAMAKPRKSEAGKTGCGVLPCLLLLIVLCSVAIFYVTHTGEHAELQHSSVQGSAKSLPITSHTVEVHHKTPVPVTQFETTSSRTEQYADHSVATQVHTALLQHPLHSLSAKARAKMSLEDHFVFMHEQPECQHVPIFTSMANVFSDLYWQLIENFIYTMVKFNVSSCTLMVCVSDPKCMKLCADSSFPCYDFQYSKFHSGKALPSALEQIGELKLLHLPKALDRGVDMMMLDLDVGFIDDPMHMVRKLHNSKSDIFVQKDLAFVMNRTLEGWRTWYTEPIPNIGIMLCRGNKKTVRMFDIAWKEYKAINKPIKHNPGKDQIKVVLAMRIARRFGLKWQYLPDESAVLLDKIYKFDGITTYELGGQAAELVLHDKGADAVHTTCYEQKSKVMGLKAANAFWNPTYYDPHRRTLTKQLIYLNDQQLRWEVRSLLYLAIATNRSVIIPNILGNELLGDVQLFAGNALWPGFRVAFFKKTFTHPVQILEPAFYWRVRRDYAQGYYEMSNATVVSLHSVKPYSINAVERLLLSEELHHIPRIVLYAAHNQGDNNMDTAPDIETLLRVLQWSEDSVGIYPESYDTETRRYGKLPQLGGPYSGANTSALSMPEVAQDIINDVRLCNQLLNPNMGNRSCFDKCK